MTLAHVFLSQAKSGLVGNVLLLRDFDRRKREIESMEVRMTSLKEAQVITLLKFGYNYLIHLSAGAVDQGGQAAFGAVEQADWLDAEAVATRINAVYVCALAQVLCGCRVGGLAAEFTVKKNTMALWRENRGGKIRREQPSRRG